MKESAGKYTRGPINLIPHHPPSPLTLSLALPWRLLSLTTSLRNLTTWKISIRLSGFNSQLEAKRMSNKELFWSRPHRELRSLTISPWFQPVSLRWSFVPDSGDLCMLSHHASPFPVCRNIRIRRIVLLVSFKTNNIHQSNPCLPTWTTSSSSFS